MLYAAVLTLLGAAIAGVVPGLKVTRGLQARLRAATAGGGGLNFGGLWTAVIVTRRSRSRWRSPQSPSTCCEADQLRTYDLGFPANEHLSARLELDRDAELDATGDTSSGVTVATVLPLMYHGWSQIEVDQGAVAPHDSTRGTSGELGGGRGGLLRRAGHSDSLGPGLSFR